MRIITGFDEECLKEIARASGNKQIVKDVSYLRTIQHFKSRQLYCERLENFAFFAGYGNSDHFRLVGIGVRSDQQGKGYGKFMLQRAMNHARECGFSFMKTRTLNGVDFYQRFANAKIIGMAGNDFLLEIKL